MVRAGLQLSEQLLSVGGPDPSVIQEKTRH